MCVRVCVFFICTVTLVTATLACPVHEIQRSQIEILFNFNFSVAVHIKY
jgi:hypothetical protein